MAKPTIWQWLGSIAAFAVAMDGFWWMASRVSDLHGQPKLERLGAICAYYAVAGVVSVAWAWLVSLVARRRNWTADNCKTAGLLLGIPGFVAVITGRSYGSLGVYTGMVFAAVVLSQKFTFPAKSLEDLSGPPAPIGLLSK